MALILQTMYHTEEDLLTSDSNASRNMAPKEDDLLNVIEKIMN